MSISRDTPLKRYNATMSKSEKIKKILLIMVMLAASGYFLYSGFSILFEEESSAELPSVR